MDGDEELIRTVAHYFDPKDRQQIGDLLSSLTVESVMAGSDSNLRNTKLAVVKLSKGNVAELIHYITCAKKDFRDVISWADEV